MKTMLIATVSAAMLATSAAAADFTAEIGVDVIRDVATGDYGATPSVELSFGSKGEDATVFGGGKVVGDMTGVDKTLLVDQWYIGMNFGATSVSLGDQEDLFDFGGLEAVGSETLANPADDYESIIVRHGDFAGFVGFGSFGTDVTEVKNVQLSYGHDYGTVNVLGAVDYNVNSKEYIVAVAADSNVTEQINLGATLTYESLDVVTNDSLLAYEAVATYSYNDNLDIAGFVNGDEHDAAQNIGAGVVYTKDALKAYAEVGYNLDTKEAVPAVGVSFSF